MKMKKIVAFIAFAVVLVSSITVNAQTTVNGTKIDFPITADEYFKIQNTEYVSIRNSSIKYKVTSKDESYAMLMKEGDYASQGKRALRLYGKGTNVGGADGAARISFFIGEQTADNKYVISFDAHRVYTDWQDYVTLNEYEWNNGARLDTTTIWEVTELGKGSEIGGGGDAVWNRYEATLTTENVPQLDFSVYSWGVMFIDNIIVKDTEGNIIFSEDFEAYESIDETLPDYECIEYGLYQGDELQYEITDGTTYTIKATLHNYKIDDGLDAQIIAFLRKNGERVDAVASDAELISKSGYGTPDTEITTYITVGDLSDGEYELTVYLWEGLENMKILAHCKLYKEAE